MSDGGSSDCTRTVCAVDTVDDNEDYGWSDHGIGDDIGIVWNGQRVSKPHLGWMYRDVDEKGGGGVDEDGRLIGPAGLGLESDVGRPDGEVRQMRCESVVHGLVRRTVQARTAAVRTGTVDRVAAAIETAASELAVPAGPTGPTAMHELVMKLCSHPPPSCPSYPAPIAPGVLDPGGGGDARDGNDGGECAKVGAEAARTAAGAGFGAGFWAGLLRNKRTKQMAASTVVVGAAARSAGLALPDSGAEVTILTKETADAMRAAGHEFGQRVVTLRGFDGSTKVARGGRDAPFGMRDDHGTVRKHRTGPAFDIDGATCDLLSVPTARSFGSMYGLDGEAFLFDRGGRRYPMTRNNGGKGAYTIEIFVLPKNMHHLRDGSPVEVCVSGVVAMVERPACGLSASVSSSEGAVGPVLERLAAGVAELLVLLQSPAGRKLISRAREARVERKRTGPERLATGVAELLVLLQSPAVVRKLLSRAREA